MQTGQYGKFEGEWYILLEDRGNLALVIGVGSDKKQIKKSNFVVASDKPNVCDRVTYEGTDYLITKSKRIISLDTNKYMKWDDKHPIRKAILGLKGLDRAKQVLKYRQGELVLS